MLQHEPTSPSDERSLVALVDGDPVMRRARQLMLRGERYAVRAYASSDALLADPAARGAACIVADADMGAISGRHVLRALRSAGWRGSAILLAETISPALAEGALAQRFAVLSPTSLGDGPLLSAIRSAIAASLAGEP